MPDLSSPNSPTLIQLTEKLRKNAAAILPEKSVGYGGFDVPTYASEATALWRYRSFIIIIIIIIRFRLLLFSGIHGVDFKHWSDSLVGGMGSPDALPSRKKPTPFLSLPPLDENPQPKNPAYVTATTSGLMSVLWVQVILPMCLNTIIDAVCTRKCYFHTSAT